MPNRSSGLVQSLEGVICMHSELCQRMPLSHAVHQCRQLGIVWLWEQTVNYRHHVLGGGDVDW